MTLSDLGPYAAYVWPAWGISALVLGGLVVRTLMAARRWQKSLAELDGDARAQAARSAVAPETSAQAARSAVAPTE